MMGRSRNIIESSGVSGLNAAGSNCEDSVSSARRQPQFCSDNEGFIRVGSIEVPLNKGTAPCCGKYIMVGRIKVSLMKWLTPYNTIVKCSSSPPLLAGRCLSTDSRSMSNPIPSSGTTVHSENPNLRIVQTNVDNYGSIGSSSASSTLYRAERLPARKIRSLDKSSPTMNFGKKRKFAYANRSNHAILPFDICLPGRQNMNSDVSLHVNKECYTEMEEGLKEDRILRPGMVLLKHYITDDKQVELVKICRKLGLGPGGFYRPGYEGGAKLRLQMMCLGLDWDPQTRKYGNERSIDGSKPSNIPNECSILTKMAIEQAQYLIKDKLGVSNVEEVLPSISPDICIVNFYTANGRLGLHQDRDESRESLRKGLPVVSFSVGDSAEFLYGDQRDVEKAEKVLLESGDVLIFGGESRHVFHGVSSIIPDSAPKELLEGTGLRPGRLNLTFREF